MVWGTWIAAILLAVTVVIYRMVPPRLRALVLVVASYVFYMWAFPPHGLVLLGLTAAVYALSLAMEGSSHPKRWLAGGVALVLSVLAVSKYSAMAVGTLDVLLTRVGLHASLPIPDFVAPLGMSYVSFMCINYLVELYRGTAPRVGVIAFASYVAFFPTIVAGPIKRYPEYVRDLGAQAVGPRAAGVEGHSEPRGVPQAGGTSEDVAEGLRRIVIGLAKKFVIADSLTPLLAPLALSSAASSDPLQLLLAVYAFAFRLYYDFAGYSDIAIGASRLMGFRIIENFDRPYLRRNLAEFWRSWHISLTRFITEYVYIPLGGSRVGRWNTARNTLVAFALSGLWHGAAWHFVAWGLWHGVGLLVVRSWRRFSAQATHRVGWLKRASHHRAGRALGYGAGVFVTFNYVAFGWVLFDQPLGKALIVYERIFTGFGHAAVTMLRQVL